MRGLSPSVPTQGPTHPHPSSGAVPSLPSMVAASGSRNLTIAPSVGPTMHRQKEAWQAGPSERQLRPWLKAQALRPS